MPPPIFIATLQAALLSAVSNVIGQIIGLYKSSVCCFPPGLYTYVEVSEQGH